MAQTPSLKTYMETWSEYGKQPIDYINMNPRERSDFRLRIRRETLWGKITVFHENIETYITRQMRAYTTTRVFLHWLFVYLLTTKCFVVFMNTFPDPHKYGGFRSHPNYKRLGAAWSWIYYGRNFFMVWILWRMSRMLYFRVKDQLNGKEDLLSTLQYDWQWDDLHRDAEDMRYVNFRYNDHKDREAKYSFWTHQIYKPNADKAKQAYRYYRYGSDSIPEKMSRALGLV